MANSDSMSTCSDVSESLISSISGVSGYQEEFQELRHLLNPNKYPQSTVRSCVTPTQQLESNDRLKELTDQLHEALKQNEKYKSDLYSLEKKVELSFYDKIDSLINKNRQLEKQVENSNGQIERLIKNFGGAKCNLTCSRCLQLEKSNFLVNSQVLTLKDEVSYYRSNNSKLVNEARQLSIELQEVKPLVEIKNVCIKDLKGKISSQHVEIQNQIKNFDLLSGKVNGLLTDLEHVRKSEGWYKEQLHVCQNDRKLYSEEVLRLKTVLIGKDKDLDDLRIQLGDLHRKFDDLQLKYFKVSKNNAVVPIVDVNNSPVKETDITPKLLAEYYQKTIQDLSNEIAKIKENIEEKEKNYSKIAKENSELVSQCLMLQKSQELSQSNLQDYDVLIKDLQQKLTLVTKSDTSKAKELKNLQLEVQRLQIELTARNQEKTVVETTIETIRQQFNLLKTNYESIKKELNKKNNEILHLQQQKQELFMNNNWNVCELEKVKEQLLIIKKLQEIIAKHEEEIQGLQKTIEENQLTIKQLNQQILTQEELKLKEITNYDDIIIQYKNIVRTNDAKIYQLQQEIDETTIKIEHLHDNTNILKKHIQEKNEQLNKLTEENNNLQNSNKKLLEDNKKQQKYLNDQILKLQDKKTVDLKRRFVELQDKVRFLAIKTDETYETLKKIGCEPNDSLESNDCDEVKNLRALLKLREMEIKEKQKKYELNYRTLLRKVKEHMKGRNSAEKQNFALQTLYNDLAEEHNTLKLESSSKDYDLANSRQLLEDYLKINTKLKQNLEQELNNVKVCNKCTEFDVNLRKIEDLQKFIEELKDNKNSLQEELLKNNEIVLKLNEQLQDLDQEKTENSNLIIENSNLHEKINSLQEITEQDSKKIQELNQEINKIRQQKTEIETELKQIKVQIQDITEKYEFITQEHKLLSCQLHEKTEEIEQLRKQKINLEENSAKKEKELTNVLEKLKEHVQWQQSELESNKTEKYFLQRLCNDLKIALQSNVSQNKSLKQHFAKLLKEKEEFNSLPMFLPEMPSNQYDDKYISDLLQQNKAPMQDKPLIEIKGCLDSLKTEIATLQQQISRKNKFST